MFTAQAYRGNPLAVIVDGDGLTDEEMRRIANWTNLSETTFLLAPTDPSADYRVRIFTTTTELPFAGHPTLGSCQVWLDAGGAPAQPDVIVQECGVGLVTIARRQGRLAFAAPPLIRSGPVDDDTRARVASVLDGTEIVDLTWADNGPGWIAVRLARADDVLAVTPRFGDDTDLKLGLVGPTAGDLDVDVEVRAFFPGPTGMAEDPVTGSLNAAVAQWLLGNDPTIESYVARQGTALGRDGRVFVERDGDTIWIGGDVTTCVVGTIEA